MNKSTAKGFAYMLVALAFVVLLVCRFVDKPIISKSFSRGGTSEHTLGCTLPIVVANFCKTNCDPLCGKGDASVRLLTIILKTFFAPVQSIEICWKEHTAEVQRTQPIWLLNRAMLC